MVKYHSTSKEFDDKSVCDKDGFNKFVILSTRSGASHYCNAIG